MIAAAVRRQLHADADTEHPEDPANAEPAKIVLCACRSGMHHVHSSVLEGTPPPLPRYKCPGHEMPLVSVLTPTTSDRHWSHANLYRCFAQQTWPNKELVVLDTGVSPSPFFTALDDVRVRYTHIELPDNTAELITSLEMLVGAADAPPGGGRPQTAWSDAWRGPLAAIEETTQHRQWFELEDETCTSPVYAALAARCISLGTKRNWLASKARGELLANFDDDDLVRSRQSNSGFSSAEVPCIDSNGGKHYQKRIATTLPLPFYCDAMHALRLNSPCYLSTPPPTSTGW